LLGEGDSRDPEPSLKPGIYEEGTSCRVHSSDVHSVLDVLNSPLGAAFVPMFVIFMLSQKRDSVLGLIRIKLGHVQIINELEQLVLADGSECLTRLLF
jgi:hypothetical protein